MRGGIKPYAIASMSPNGQLIGNAYSHVKSVMVMVSGENGERHKELDGVLLFISTCVV